MPTTGKNSEGYLASGDVARYLHLSKNTVDRAVCKGLLRPHHITPGKHNRFTLAEVERFRMTLTPHRSEADPWGD